MWLVGWEVQNWWMRRKKKGKTAETGIFKSRRSGGDMGLVGDGQVKDLRAMMTVVAEERNRES